MILLTIMTMVLIGMLCVLAYWLAVFAAPLMLALVLARLAYATGAGIVGAGLVGLFASATAFGILVFLFAALRSPVLRIGVALIFAAPAAVAGYALVFGVTHAVPSELWRQAFCIAGGLVTGLSAVARLTAQATGSATPRP